MGAMKELINNQPELNIKEVQFNGVTLVGIQERDSNKILVSVKKICEDLGIDSKAQIQRIKRDDILSEGGCILHLPSPGGVQETFCLENELLPFFLTGISIKKCKEGVRPYLKEFKLKAKDILAQAFIKPESNNQENKTFNMPKTHAEALRALANEIEEKEKLLLENKEMKPKSDQFDLFLSGGNSQTMMQVAKSLGWGRNRLFEFLRNNKVLMRNNLPYQSFVDSGYFSVRVVSIQRSQGVENKTQTLVTSKGMSFITGLLRGDNKLVKVGSR